MAGEPAEFNPDVVRYGKPYRSVVRDRSGDIVHSGTPPSDSAIGDFCEHRHVSEAAAWRCARQRANELARNAARLADAQAEARQAGAWWWPLALVGVPILAVACLVALVKGCS